MAKMQQKTKIVAFLQRFSMRAAVKKAREKRADRRPSETETAPAPALSLSTNAKPGRCSVRACPYPAVLENLCRAHHADKTCVTESTQKCSLPEHVRADSRSHHSAGWKPRHEKRDHQLF